MNCLQGHDGHYTNKKWLGHWGRLTGLVKDLCDSFSHKPTNRHHLNPKMLENRNAIAILKKNPLLEV